MSYYDDGFYGTDHTVSGFTNPDTIQYLTSMTSGTYLARLSAIPHATSARHST